MGVYATNAVITVVLMAAVLPIAMIPILGTTVRRFGTLHRWPLVAAIGLVGAAAALAAYTVFPLPDPASLVCDGDRWRDYWELDPTAAFRAIAVESPGFPAVLWSGPMLQVILNVLLFVPYGFFLHQVTRWRSAAVIGMGAATSLLIEVTQGTAFFGAYACPYRLFDTADLIVNTAGAALGVALSLWAIRRFAWVSPDPVLDVGRVRIRRRVWAGVVDVVLIGGLGVVAQVGTAVTVGNAGAPEGFDAWIAARPWAPVVFQLAPAVVIGLVVPALRRDRATPGQAVLDMAPVRADARATPGGARAIWGRFGARWLWWGLVPWYAVGVLVIAEVITVLRRHDSRSVAGLAGGTDTRSRTAIDADRSRGAAI